MFRHYIRALYLFFLFHNSLLSLWYWVLLLHHIRKHVISVTFVMLHLIKFRCYRPGISIIKLLIRMSEAWHCEGFPQTSPLEMTSETSTIQRIEPNLYLSISERSESQNVQRWANLPQAGRQIKTEKQRSCERQLELCAGGRGRNISQPGLGLLKPWAVLPQWLEYFTEWRPGIKAESRAETECAGIIVVG